MPEHLDIALTEIASLHDKVHALEAVVAALEAVVATQNSLRARYKDYVLGGFVGALISILLALVL